MPDLCLISLKNIVTHFFVLLFGINFVTLHAKMLLCKEASLYYAY